MDEGCPRLDEHRAPRPIRRLFSARVRLILPTEGAIAPFEHGLMGPRRRLAPFSAVAGPLYVAETAG
jgi:hypothetical protein